jgi:release factor glutamine methyltransferase
MRTPVGAGSLESSELDSTEKRLMTLGTAMLARAGVETPAADARALLAHAAAAARLEESAMALFERRAKREPLAYIVGSCRFCGLDLLVDRRVLVPTEERTGTLVDAALEAPRRSRVHEVGTGSGAVALAIKAARPDLVVTASDISRDAIDVAGENGRRLNLDVAFTQADGLPAGHFELVVANLPYTDTGQLSQELPPEESRFQPGVALWAGHDSLALIRRLIHQVPKGTRLAVEHGPHHTSEVSELLDDPKTLRDARGDERVTVGTARAEEVARVARGGSPL